MHGNIGGIAPRSRANTYVIGFYPTALDGKMDSKAIFLKISRFFPCKEKQSFLRGKIHFI
jgi:hypothetical protein